MNPRTIWGGVALKNGNYLAQNEKERKSIELNRDGDIVWSVSITEIQSQLDAFAPGLGQIKKNKPVNAYQMAIRQCSLGFVIQICLRKLKLPQTKEWCEYLKIENILEMVYLLNF